MSGVSACRLFLEQNYEEALKSAMEELTSTPPPPSSSASPESDGGGERVGKIVLIAMRSSGHLNQAATLIPSLLTHCFNNIHNTPAYILIEGYSSQHSPSLSLFLFLFLFSFSLSFPLSLFCFL